MQVDSRPTTGHPYAAFMHLVLKPARYLGGEFGAKPKSWSAVSTRVCLAFPDVYDIGMSHLGYKILYRIFNDDPAMLAERCYTPWIDMERELRARSLPLISLESARPLSDFDVVGFSLQFELTYSNILTMLDLGGIPLRSADRSDSDPLVIAGGPSATHPEPMAPFFDAILIGDGEERFPEVARLWAKMRADGASRGERLLAIAKLEGVYVPSLYEALTDETTGFEVVTRSLADGLSLPIRRAHVADINRFPFPDDGPIGGPEAIFDRMSIEVARGCTEGCRFCQAGMIYRPVRERDPEEIVKTVVAAVKNSGYDEVSLTSLSTADYSCIAPLIKKVVDKLTPERVSLSVSSLRAYGLEENVLDDIQGVRAAGLTFAPEAGSQRMRDVVNKNVTEEQLMTTAERVFSRAWSTMKLYFMIGLPTEEEFDVREIARVGGRARSVGERVKRELGVGGAPKVTVSVSTHVPKPHTPFQWCAMDSQDQVRQKQAWLREEARLCRVDLRTHDSDSSWLEGVLARGDRKLANVIERAYRAGARFDSWDELKNPAIWLDAFAAENIDISAYLGTIPVTARLPWDHIDVGLADGFLAKEYRKALKDRLSPPCGKAVGMFMHHTNLQEADADRRKLVCYDCGVACDLGAMRDERLVYLRKLGADTPRAASPAPVVRPKGRAAPPVRALSVDAPVHRYRFAFTKVGASAFLSHLDVIRALPRAFRRLELPVAYSRGFHPMPDMIFGPALSLGVSSLCEMVDIKIAAQFEPSSVLAELSRSSPDGFDFTSAVALESSDVALSKTIDTARYAVAISKSTLASFGGEEWLQKRANEMRSASTLRVMRRIDGVGKWVDVKEYLRRIEVGSSIAEEAIARAGVVGNVVALLVDIEIRPTGSAKISEVLEVIEGVGEGDERALAYRAVRSELGLWNDGEIIAPTDTSRLPKKNCYSESVEKSVSTDS